MKYKPLALAAAALTVGLLSFGAAQAANVMTGSSAPAATAAPMQDGNIQLASHRWHRHHGGSGVVLGFGLPLFGGGSYYDGYGDGYGYGGGYGYGSGYGYGYGNGPYRSYYAPRAYYAPVGGSHVRWCMNRYRTYDPRSNTFRGYDGDLHQCRSPYRY